MPGCGGRAAGWVPGRCIAEVEVPDRLSRGEADRFAALAHCVVELAHCLVDDGEVAVGLPKLGHEPDRFTECAEGLSEPPLCVVGVPQVAPRDRVRWADPERSLKFGERVARGSGVEQRDPQVIVGARLSRTSAGVTPEVKGCDAVREVVPVARNNPEYTVG